MTTPRDSHALCLLGLAQLAQYDSNPNSDRSKEALSNACLSFQASIELEHKTQSGEPPKQLSGEYTHCFYNNVEMWQVLHFSKTLSIPTSTISLCSEQKWWQAWLEAENEKAARQSNAQPAGVKGPPDSTGAKRGARQGRGGLSQGRTAVAVTKAPAPAPIRGGKAVRTPAKTPAAR